MELPLAFTYDAISTGHTRPHNVPREVLGHIMSFVRDNDLTACISTNSSFYLAAKPYLYRTVSLDQYFHVIGAEHPLLDLDIPATPNSRRRPLFRRTWMTRTCRILEVAAHHESFCANAVASYSKQPFPPAPPLPHRPLHPLLPNLPHLRTLHLPFDVHGTLVAAHELTPCGVHDLKPLHLIEHNVCWVAQPPSTTTIRGVQSYTANIAPHEMWNYDHRPFELHLPIMAPGARLTLIAPQNINKHILPQQCPIFRDPEALSTIPHDIPPAARAQVYTEICTADDCPHHLMLKLARTVVRFMDGPRIRLVGFDVACKDRPYPVYRHLAWLTRVLFEALAEAATLNSEADAWRARAGPVDAFHLISARWWTSHRVQPTAYLPSLRLVEFWDIKGWPRSVSRVAGNGGIRTRGATWPKEVKGEGTIGAFWLPEPEREWCLVDD
ncbi:uncharacterized protein CcaverHIS019_0607690 [Cutaneotrichosporon cavernicola]|uniref:F-box domain-containing protein n=1 Tax=Cutaneotrichosporon cavernicola TaxID=279322 RepID=A0AA48L9D4_9TREE|nr:uncharacterized protein CcaverHIS019_0607690 [Cutaneotrichosporon cavernicola]BEI94310.1 hypothetical protein CcaverHIS019_0607690 [Cutaneotrichosporon cavernicola]BEJ09850.1 hypothetical protein CcaverHIS641_0607650 [Cutaneotrichosporon cavernicola]